MKVANYKIVLPLLLLTGAVFAAAGEVTDVVILTAEQIHADQGQLKNLRFVSSGQPDEETLALFKDAGFSTVIDMRTAEEDRKMDEASVVAGLGMNYVLMPIGSADDVSFDNARELDRVLADSDGPVLVHCASGNRVGALFALRAKLNGATSEDALMVGKQAGLTRLEDTVKKRLAED